MQKAVSLACAIFATIALGITFAGCRRQASDTPSAAAVEAVNRGVSLMGQYDYAGAVDAFAQALAAAPAHPDVQVNLALARFNRGKKEDQDIEQATALLDAVLKSHPDHARALYGKAIILQHVGQAEAAIPLLEQVLKLHPDDGVAWYVLGLCKQRVGQDPEKELLRAIELHPYLVSGYYRLWQTLQAAGQSERAAPYLARFKQLREHPLAETIELPQYNQMGDLALVTPLHAASNDASATFAYSAGPARELVSRPATAASAGENPSPFGGVGFAPAVAPAEWQLFPVGWPGAAAMQSLHLRLRGDATSVVDSELSATSGVLSLAIGDYDNDETADLLAVLPEGVALFHGSAEGSFTRVAGVFAEAAGRRTRSALWLDADHDGDLDLFLCNASGPDQLFNNNGDGTFAEIAESAGLARPEGDSVMVLPGDVDGDRDMDLVVLRAGAPARIFLNELSGHYREAVSSASVRGDLGGVLQDIDGDGILDLLVLSDHPALPALYVGDGHGGFQASKSFAQTATAAATFGIIRALRVVDFNLDGHPDVALFGEEGHILINDGTGIFTPLARVWQPTPGFQFVGAEVADITGDLVPDTLLLEHGATDRVRLVAGHIDPTPTAVAIAPTGVRSRDKRTRSPASGYGTMVTVRSGMREQSRWNTGQSGGFAQSPLPLIFGLAGATQVDYARLHWPDGVMQVELPLAAGRVHLVAETQRKVSSCPVLFTWNGREFEFVTDFAGVGGLGYFVGAGEYAPPQPVDRVKIEPGQLRERNGRFELRITEPMEESAYVDRLELLAIDHPDTWQLFPDERLALSGTPPTGELLVVRQPVFPARAIDAAGSDCTPALARVDRHYAYAPTLDRRFPGFCLPHSLELDFGDRLGQPPAGGRVFLFINGYLEYPYSQTNYAAGQARVAWEPIRVERRMNDDRWQTIVPDAGALGGMARTMTVDLTGLIDGSDCRLRLTTNLEIYYDQIFLAAVQPAGDAVSVRSLSLVDADLRYSGYARETSPDGREPLIFDYQQSEPDAPFATLRGAYTRYGPVEPLLARADDTFVLMASGDEIAASFDARELPALSPGSTRSFVLVAHAYCKDMDPYTGTPRTLEPMPYRGMRRYPYPDSERPAETPEQRRLRDIFNTRIVE